MPPRPSRASTLYCPISTPRSRSRFTMTEESATYATSTCIAPTDLRWLQRACSSRPLRYGRAECARIGWVVNASGCLALKPLLQPNGQYRVPSELHVLRSPLHGMHNVQQPAGRLRVPVRTSEDEVGQQRIRIPLRRRPSARIRPALDGDGLPMRELLHRHAVPFSRFGARIHDRERRDLHVLAISWAPSERRRATSRTARGASRG
jgi:hypothetical protein